MNIPPISYPHFRFDNVEMAVRKSVKRAEMHREWQQDWSDYYRTKREDHVKLQHDLRNYNLIKDIELIKAYDNLQRHLTYDMYRYNTSLGRNLDVFV